MERGLDELSWMSLMPVEHAVLHVKVGRGRRDPLTIGEDNPTTLVTAEMSRINVTSYCMAGANGLETSIEQTEVWKGKLASMVVAVMQDVMERSLIAA